MSITHQIGFTAQPCPVVPALTLIGEGTGLAWAVGDGQVYLAMSDGEGQCLIAGLDFASLHAMCNDIAEQMEANPNLPALTEMVRQ
jgi:hypothetical protein